VLSATTPTTTSLSVTRNLLDVTSDPETLRQPFARSYSRNASLIGEKSIIIIIIDRRKNVLTLTLRRALKHTCFVVLYNMFELGRVGLFLRHNINICIGKKIKNKMKKNQPTGMYVLRRVNLIHHGLRL